MNDWIDINKQQPPVNTLVLVYQRLTGRCLRNMTQGGEFYDENEIYDDSGLEITHWTALIDPPNS